MSEIETRVLDVRLTEQEIIERSKAQAELIKKITDVESEKTETAKKLGDKIKVLTRQLRGVAEEVRSGVKYVEVEVSRSKDPKRGVEETIRVDTGEVISTRALSPAEMQLDLIQGKSEKKAKAN